VQVYNNTFGRNQDHGVRVADDSRRPVTDDVSIHHNAKNGDPMYDCSLRGVACYDNR
jgi:hypothetical protein